MLAIMYKLINNNSADTVTKKKPFFNAVSVQ